MPGASSCGCHRPESTGDCTDWNQQKPAEKAGTQEKDAKKCLKHGIDDIYDIPFGLILTGGFHQQLGISATKMRMLTRKGSLDVAEVGSLGGNKPALCKSNKPPLEMVTTRTLPSKNEAIPISTSSFCLQNPLRSCQRPLQGVPGRVASFTVVGWILCHDSWLEVWIPKHVLLCEGRPYWNLSITLGGSQVELVPDTGEVKLHENLGSSTWRGIMAHAEQGI